MELKNYTTIGHLFCIIYYCPSTESTHKVFMTDWLTDFSNRSNNITCFFINSKTKTLSNQTFLWEKKNLKKKGKKISVKERGNPVLLQTVSDTKKTLTCSSGVNNLVGRIC